MKGAYKVEQIQNGFCDYYYLTEEGKVYNKKTQKYLKLDRHNYILMTKDKKAKKVPLKTLYKLVYDKVYCIDNIQDEKGEVWKVIPNTNDNYYISNYGRVKSKAQYNAILLKATVSEKGYEKVMIIENNERKNKFVHTLVAQCFLQEPKDKNKEYQIHHKDQNGRNNNVNNLMYVTIQEHYNIHYGTERNK